MEAINVIKCKESKSKADGALVDTFRHKLKTLKKNQNKTRFELKNLNPMMPITERQRSRMHSNLSSLRESILLQENNLIRD